MDKAKNKDFTVNNHKEDNNQALVSGTNGNKYTQVKEDMSLSRSSISKLERLWWKLSFQKRGKEKPKIGEIGRFLTMIILNKLIASTKVDTLPLPLPQPPPQIFLKMDSDPITHNKISVSGKIPKDICNSLSGTLMEPPNYNVGVLPIKVCPIATLNNPMPKSITFFRKPPLSLPLKSTIPQRNLPKPICTLHLQTRSQPMR